MAETLEIPVSPQLALTRKTLPKGEEWLYEQKLDGFRAIAFVSGPKFFLQSRGGRPLNRYFPEFDPPEGRYVVDGELVVLDANGHEDFDALQNRLHPAESRVNMLAAEIPVTYRVFDLLQLEDRVLFEEPFRERRAKLEELVRPPLELSPITEDPELASRWLTTGEGAMAKRADAPYVPGRRHGMVKVKRVRTIDCVVAGWRVGKEEGTVGSLMLGLYDESGELKVVGHTSSFKAAEKRELVDKLKAYETGEKGSGEPSRWTGDKDLSWFQLRPELVVEVSFDHVAAGRIRHGAKLLRWREDKPAEECRLEQLTA